MQFNKNFIYRSQQVICANLKSIFYFSIAFLFLFINLAWIGKNLLPPTCWKTEKSRAISSRPHPFPNALSVKHNDKMKWESVFSGRWRTERLRVAWFVYPKQLLTFSARWSGTLSENVSSEHQRFLPVSLANVFL